jgi:hypothetical protein
LHSPLAGERFQVAKWRALRNLSALVIAPLKDALTAPTRPRTNLARSDLIADTHLSVSGQSRLTA